MIKNYRKGENGSLQLSVVVRFLGPQIIEGNNEEELEQKKRDLIRASLEI
jgi:hypothetical protein